MEYAFVFKDPAGTNASATEFCDGVYRNCLSVYIYIYIYICVCVCVCVCVCIYIYIYIYIRVALRPNANHGLLILEVSRSHTTKRHSR